MPIGELNSIVMLKPIATLKVKVEASLLGGRKKPLCMNSSSFGKVSEGDDDCMLDVSRLTAKRNVLTYQILQLCRRSGDATHIDSFDSIGRQLACSHPLDSVFDSTWHIRVEAETGDCRKTVMSDMRTTAPVFDEVTNLVRHLLQAAFLKRSERGKAWHMRLVLPSSVHFVPFDRENLCEVLVCATVLQDEDDDSMIA
jgi:hypothetical protein